MALVLRKAVLQQKNMSLLKFYKGRSVTYNNLGVSYRKNRTYLLLSPCEVSVQSYRDIGDVRDKIGGIPSKIPISPTPDKDSLVTAGSDWAIPPGSSAKLSKATGCENSSSQAATSDASASAQACSCSQLPNHSVTPSCNIQLPVYNYGQPPLCNHGQAPKCNCTKPNCSCSHTSFCNCAKPSFCSCTKPISYGQPPVGYGQTCCIQNHCNCSQTSHSQLQCGCSAHTPRGDVTVDVGKNCGCNSHAVNHKPVITYSSTCGYIGSTCPCATCGPMASSAPCPPCEPYQPSHYPCGHPCSPSGACTPGAWGPGGPSPCPTCPCPCPSPCPPRPQKKCVPCPECASRLAAAAISTATMAATAVAATAVPAVDRTPASAAPPSSNIKLGHNKKTTAVRRRMKLEKPRQNPTIEKIQKTLPSTAVEVNDQVFSSPSLRCCYSCPNVTKIRDQTGHSPFRTRTVFEIPSTQTKSNKSSKTPAMSRLLQANLSQMSFMRNYSDCNLPPPSNQAPRCVQTMTGYYYYPYGWWFCGPYHVTGLCCPVGPGGPCPPKCAPPCPPKCCPCGPCTPMPPRIGGCSCCNCVCPASTTAPANAPVPQGQSPLKQLKDASQNPEMNPQSMRSRISKFFPVNTAVPAGASEMPYKRNSPNTAIVPRNPNKVAKGYSGTLDHPRKMSHYAAPYTRQTNHLLEVKEMTNDKSPFNQKAGNNVPSRGYHHVAESRYKVQRSPIYHKRYRSLTFDTCPTIGLPKAMLSLEQTDKIPEVVFEYSSIPNCPNPLGNFDLNFKPYESNF